MTPEPVLVQPDGRPARPVKVADCPRCGSGPDRRRASAGFGVPHPVCGACGHEWPDEEWR